MVDVAVADAPKAKADDQAPTRVRLPKGTLFEEGQYRRRWMVKAPANATQDDVRHQDFLGPVATKLTRHDIITILADDETWEMECCVERVMQDAVQISVRKLYSRETQVHPGRVVDGLGNFYSEWRAGEGWCIVRRKDSHAIIKGHALEATAVAQWQREQPRQVPR